MTVTLALSKGTSIVTESIFENRFKYVDELSRMGAEIKVEGNSAVISGVERFKGAAVSAPDLRAGAALVIAAWQQMALRRWMVSNIFSGAMKIWKEKSEVSAASWKKLIMKKIFKKLS